MAGVVEDYACYFAAIGVLSLSYVALRALYTLWRGFKSYVIGLGVDVKSLGQWAGMLRFLVFLLPRFVLKYAGERYD